MCRISVVIATRNRSTALKAISFPSLAKQDFKDFEVIIWDASDNGDSKEAVEEFKGDHPSLEMYYHKAPRVGSASQRNDAVKVTKGDIIFFIDDDSEVSSDGLFSLKEAFEDQEIFGSGLKLKSKTVETKTVENLENIFRKFYYILFRMPHSGKKRLVMLSGWNIWPKGEEFFEEAEWLSGCSMAFRRSIFNKFKFEEGLEKFGGYALGEDFQFSHRILRNKIKIMLAEKGYIIHHLSKGGRLAKAELFSAQVYNQFLIWRTAIYPYNKLSLFVYLWSLVGEITRYYLAGIFKNDPIKIKGTSIGLKAIMDVVRASEHGDK